MHFCKVFHQSFDSFFCLNWETAGCWEFGQTLWYWYSIVMKKMIELHKILGKKVLTSLVIEIFLIVAFYF